MLQNIPTNQYKQWAPWDPNQPTTTYHLDFGMIIYGTSILYINIFPEKWIAQYQLRSGNDCLSITGSQEGKLQITSDAATTSHGGKIDLSVELL